MSKKDILCSLGSMLPLACLVLVCLSIGIQHCFSFGPASRDNKKASKKHLPVATNKFAEKLYQEIANKSGKSSNVVVSPPSIQTALAMVAMGARGNTLKELEETLNIAVNEPAWREKMEKTTNNSQVAGKEYVVQEIANLLLISHNFPVNPEFVRDVRGIFHANAEQVDFSEPETVRLVLNKRVDNQTRGLIKEALPEGSIDVFTRMILSNVLYFKGLWLKPFDKQDTHIEPFFPDDVHQVDTPMMHIYDEEFEVADLSDLNAKAIFLPYKDERHGMLLILPNERNGLKETENLLLTSGLTPSSLLKRLQSQEVVLSLPKFKVTFKSEMNEILAKMGIFDLFSSELDLSGICPCNDLQVNKVFHESTVEVNEEGAEAAAFTRAAIVLTSATLYPEPPFVFKADHPFLFYLVDTENDSIPLFVGRVNNPLSE